MRKTEQFEKYTDGKPYFSSSVHKRRTKKKNSKYIIPIHFRQSNIWRHVTVKFQPACHFRRLTGSASAFTQRDD